MSATLKQHGFANSSDEAANQAQGVFKEKIAEPEKKEEKPMTNNPDIAKLERNFDVFKSNTQQQLSALKDDIHNVFEKMNEMIKTINELEKLKNDVTTIDEGKEKQQRLAPKMVKKPKEVKNQRVGELTPDDVNLNETFYFGNK